MANEDQNELPAHKRRVLLRPRIFDQAERLAGKYESDVAEVVNRAVRELLEREGFWPPKPDENRDSA